MKKLIGILVVLILMTGMTAPCRGKHLRPERLVGTWIVQIDGVAQIVRVRPDLTVDYGVDELQGELRLTGRRTLEWDTQGRHGQRKLTLTLTRSCGDKVRMLVQQSAATGGPTPTPGQEISWTPVHD